MQKADMKIHNYVSTKFFSVPFSLEAIALSLLSISFCTFERNTKGTQVIVLKK